MTTLVTDNLPLLANAPNGIKRIRALILELAVTGRLVEQDPAEEPVEKLIGRISAFKEAEIAAGRLKRQRALEVAPDEPEHRIPTTWRFVHLGDVVEIVRGITFPASEKSKEPGPGKIACLRTANVQNEIEWDDLLFVRESFVGRADQYLQPRDIVMSMANSRELVGKVALVGEHLSQRSTFGGFLGVLRPYLVEPRYVMALLRTPRARAALIDSASQTTNIANVSLGKLRPLTVALPPLEEQARIVAKVDELMALCDRLEAEQADAEAAHAKLVEALLASLTQARDAADFRASWKQLAEHFHALFTTEASVDALKQTVLTLALKGLLTHQDADQQSGTDLVAEVNLRRMAQVATGRLRSVDTAVPVERAGVPYTFPASWGLARMCELCEPITSGTTPPSDEMESDAGVPFLKVYNIRNQRIDFSYKPQFVNPDFHAKKMGRSSLKPFDVVMNIVGPPLGKVAIIPEDYPAWNCNQAIVFFRAIPPISHQYLYLFLCEGSFLKGIELIGTAGQDNISVTKSRNIPVPVPPVSEQHRIIAKVDELLDICDELKLNIAKAREQHEHLAAVLVEQAVS